MYNCTCMNYVFVYQVPLSKTAHEHNRQNNNDHSWMSMWVFDEKLFKSMGIVQFACDETLFFALERCNIIITINNENENYRIRV